jgi:hypothetical protein
MRFVCRKWLNGQRDVIDFGWMMNKNLLASQEGFCCMELETIGRSVFTDVTYQKYLGGSRPGLSQYISLVSRKLQFRYRGHVACKTWG